MGLIKSIGFDESEIIQNIINLYNNGNDIELDPTYSKGNFYKGIISKPKLRFDIDPKTNDVLQANCESLPLEDNSIGSIMFDPPFLATTGKSLDKMGKNNLMVKRFGVYPNEPALHEFYEKSLIEFYRILKKDGILIFKCQDKVSSGKQYFSHIFIHNIAVSLGYYPIDLFVYCVKNRIVADWQLNQKHARKFHSYFWVFKKTNKKIIYTLGS